MHLDRMKYVQKRWGLVFVEHQLWESIAIDTWWLEIDTNQVDKSHFQLQQMHRSLFVPKNTEWKQTKTTKTFQRTKLQLSPNYFQFDTAKRKIQKLLKCHFKIASNRYAMRFNTQLFPLVAETLYRPMWLCSIEKQSSKIAILPPNNQSWT